VDRHTRTTPRAVVWGLVVAACFMAAIAAPGVAAQKSSTTPNPEPLWKAYPLDENKGASTSGAQNASTTTTTARPASSPAATTQSLTVTDKAGDGPPWLLMVAAAAGGALVVVVLLTLQGRRARRREEALVAVADEWPWLTAKGGGAGGELRVERLKGAPGANGAVAERAAEPERAAPAANGAAPERVADAEPGAGAEPERAADPDADFDFVEAGAVPRRRFDREPAAARRGPICQVRWSSAGMCFYAVTSEADGVERRLGWSPPIEWGEDGPPDEESREARAALRVLAKELRDKGWRPMRAKGDDFDEPRWYARRFRLPVVEGEDAREAVARAHGSG
jgi:hypothetical protein